MSCPSNVDSAFPCASQMHEYMAEEGKEIYAHRGIFQEQESDPDEFDSDETFYGFLQSLRFVKYIETDRTSRAYVVWVHEDTQLITYAPESEPRRTSVFAIGFRPPQSLRYITEEGFQDYEEIALTRGRCATNRRPTVPVPIGHIREILVREAYDNHSEVSSIQEAKAGFYGITIGPDAPTVEQEFYYPVTARVIFRPYVIKF
jgi:hypothetical protein